VPSAERLRPVLARLPDLGRNRTAQLGHGNDEGIDVNGLRCMALKFVTLAIPSILIAPRVLSGELEVGRAIQAGGAFTAMLSALTVFIDNFELLMPHLDCARPSSPRRWPIALAR